MPMDRTENLTAVIEREGGGFVALCLKIVGGFLSLALVGGVIAPAEAVTYHTPLARSVAFANESLECRVSNVGTTPVSVSVTAYNTGGVALPLPFDGCSGILPAGASCAVALDNTVNQIARCSFDVSSGKVRAALVVVDFSTTLWKQVIPATKK